MEFFNDTSSDPQKPSLFELIAQEQLRDLLQPALKYVLAVFAQRYPRYLLRIVNRHEELYALIMLFVERRYLAVEGASFAENFYGLKRRQRPWIETARADAAVGRVVSEEKLGPRERWRSLVFLVGIPYLRARAQDYYEQLGGGIDADLLEDATRRQSSRTWTTKDYLNNAFKKIYPWANVSFELWLAAWNLAYLLDITPFYRPWLAWMGVDLRRISIEDLAPPPLSKPPTISAVKKRHIFPTLWHLLLSSPRLLLSSLKVLLPTAIFFIKFLEWWYSPSSPARMLSKPPAGPPIPPPRILLPHPQGLSVDDLDYAVCPVCRGPVQNATAMPSGYVFCYRCAYEQVETKGRCPVTLIPVKMAQLRKIMV